MSISWEMLLFVLAGGFLAAFVDSVVGGGGIISVPVLLAAGLPPAVALGTNKLASSMSSLTSTTSFFLSGKINVKVVAKLFGFSLTGAVCGTLTLRGIPSDFLKPLVVVMLIAITVYTLLRRSWGDRAAFRELTPRSTALLMAAAFCLGFYDGFFGPGTGSFLIFVFLLAGFDFVTAAGNSKVLNFGSNIASMFTFVAIGAVDYRIGVPMGLVMIVGSLLGSQVAIRKGAAYVRPLFVAVCVALVGKQVWDMLAA